MLRHALRRGVDPLTSSNSGRSPAPWQRRIQLLWCLVSIETDDEAVHAHLAYMDHCAAHPMAPTTEVRLGAFRAGGDGGGFRLERDGVPFDHAATPGDVLAALYRVAYIAAFEALPAGSIMFHGVTIAVGDDRILAVGRSGAGKSTLATHLVSSGFDVLGDEYAVLCDEGLTALPRRFHLKPESTEHLARVQSIADALPSVTDETGWRVVALDPAELGRRRYLEPGHLAVVIALEPNHGGPTTIEPMGELDMARVLMSLTFTPVGGGREWIARLCEVLAPAACYRLALGDVESGIIALRSVLG